MSRPVSKTKLLALVKDLDWQAVQIALDENPDLLSYRGDKGKNLLHLCCGIDIDKRGLLARDSVKLAEVLLEAGLDVNEPSFTEGSWKATPLWYAVSRGKNLTLAEFLLERGSTPEYCLWAAAFNDDAEAINLLVQAGAEIDPPGEDTPLLFAVQWSRFKGAKALLDAGADVDFQDQLGRTALHFMVKKRSDPQYIEMFLEHGASLDIPDRDGVLAGDVLSRMRDPEYRELAERYRSSRD